MKALIATALLSVIASTQTFASQTQTETKCIDTLVSFVMCENELHTPQFVQGNCPSSRYAETFYCVDLTLAPECLDTRTVRFDCREGEAVLVQGRCEFEYEAEHTYCRKNNK